MSDTGNEVPEVTNAVRKPGRPRKENSDKSELDKLKDQVALLTSALLAEKNSREKDSDPEEDPSIGVVKIGGGNLSAFLTDAYGRKRHFLWEKEGDIRYMTPAQYEELMDIPGGKRFFDRGFLKLEKEAGSILVIVDPEKFIKSLDFEAIEPTLNRMSDPAVLLRLVNYLDHTRIVTQDKNGKPLVDADGFPRAETIPWDSKQRLVAEICVSKLYEMTGVRYSLLDG